MNNVDEGLRIDLDLGDGHVLSWTSWSPDRELNPQYADLPDVERFGAIISHDHNGQLCRHAIRFSGPVQQLLEPGRPVWTVQSWEPLTLSPSIGAPCGDHGYIRNGTWVRA